MNNNRNMQDTAPAKVVFLWSHSQSKIVRSAANGNVSD